MGIRYGQKLMEVQIAQVLLFASKQRMEDILFAVIFGGLQHLHLKHVC
jgi:hypothetical protein